MHPEDQAWSPANGQFTFIVDNQTVAGLMTGKSQLLDEFYVPLCKRMVEGLHWLTRLGWLPKDPAGWMVWRERMEPNG